MINFTLKQLRYVDALARHGHFGRAAEASAISQPALSAQIKELEAALGNRLFERARQVRLTPFGVEFVDRARDILGRVDDLGDLARAAGSRLVGRLRIGVIPTIAPYFLPTLLETLSGSYRDLDIHIRETLTPTLLQELQEGRIDTAILALPVSEPSLTEVALFAEDFVLVRAAADAGKPVPDAEALREMRLLLLEEGHCFRDQALSFCKLKPGLAKDGLDASTLSTLVQMVSAGIGVTLIPEMAVTVEARSAPVAVTRFEPPRPSRGVGMVWRKNSALSEQLEQIAEKVRTTAQEMRQ